jgi:hypothetical protein
VSDGLSSRLLATLLPRALGVTIPDKRLVGILIGLSEFPRIASSSHGEACGVSIFADAAPIAFSPPWPPPRRRCHDRGAAGRNQKFREITFNILASSAEGDVKPRVLLPGARCQPRPVCP